MADKIFIDTSGFYASLTKRDEAHQQTVDIMSASSERRRGFVTTDYVLDETATLLKARGDPIRSEPCLISCSTLKRVVLNGWTRTVLKKVGTFSYDTRIITIRSLIVSVSLSCRNSN